MDQPTFVGGVFTAPWIWVILQLVVFGNPAYLAFLVLFCLVLDYFNQTDDGKTPSAEDDWTPVVVPLFGDGWFPEPVLGEDWTPVAEPDWTVVPVFDGRWFPEDDEPETPVTFPEDWTPAVVSLYGDGWFPEDEPDWTLVAEPETDWTPGVMSYSGEDWFPDSGASLDPVDTPQGRLPGSETEVCGEPPAVAGGSSGYPVKPKKKGLAAKGLRLIHHLKKMVEKRRMKSRRS